MRTQKAFLIVASLIIPGGVLLLTKKDANKSSSEPMKLGGMFALTGVGASVGTEEHKGTLLAVEEVNSEGGINGKNIEFIVEDVSFDRLSRVASAANKLLNIDKVTAIVGPTWDEPTQALLPIIEQSKVPTIGPDQTHDLERTLDAPFFFSLWYDNAVGIKRLLSFAEKRGLKRIAIIRVLGAGYFQYTRNLVREFAPNYGVAIAEDLDLGNPLETDFRTPIRKVQELPIDALFMALGDFNECTFLKQTKELGFTKPILTTEAAANQTSLKTCPELMEQLYISQPQYGSNANDFIDRFRKRFGQVPQYPAAFTAYDAVKVLTEGLRKTKGNGGDDLRNALTDIKNFSGVSQDAISFDEKGFVITPDGAFEIKTVRDGEFVNAR